MNDTITTVPVVRTCQFCGNTTKIHVNLDTNAAYVYYSVYHMGYIQNVPIDNFEKEHCKAIVREFLKTGICLDCQKLIFGGNESDYEVIRTTLSGWVLTIEIILFILWYIGWRG